MFRPPLDDGPRRAGRRPVDLDRDRRAALRELTATIRERFPRLVELYDNTASLQDRTVGTGRLDPELARRFGCGGVVGRASGRDFDARRDHPYSPYDELRFETPVWREGDVNARVWVRIREVERIVRLIGQILDRLPAGSIRSERSPPAEPARVGRWSKDSVATSSSTCVSATTDGSRAAICATRRGSSGRCSRRRSRATSSPTSRCATSRSTVPIPATTSEREARRRCAER